MFTWKSLGFKGEQQIQSNIYILYKTNLKICLVNFSPKPPDRNLWPNINTNINCDFEIAEKAL